MRFGRSRIDGQGFADQVNGNVAAPERMCNHSPQLQAADVSGIDGKNSAISLVRLGEPARLMVAPRRRKSFRNGRHHYLTSDIAGPVSLIFGRNLVARLRSRGGRSHPKLGVKSSRLSVSSPTIRVFI